MLSVKALQRSFSPTFIRKVILEAYIASFLEVNCISINTFLGAIQAAKDGFLINDLQPPAFRLEPKLASLRNDIENHLFKQKMKEEGGGVMMSGSGL